MRFKNPSLLVGLPLLLFPLAAQADAVDGLVWLLGAWVVLYALVAAMALVAVLAFWRDTKQWRWVSWGLTGLALVLGLLLEALFSNRHSLGLTNPFFALYLPLVLWLNAVWYARRTADWLRRTLAISVAVLGLSGLLVILPQLLIPRLLTAVAINSNGLWPFYLVVGLGAGVLAWWLVLRQVHKYQPLDWADWPQIVRMAAVYAGVSTAYYVLEILLMTLKYNGEVELWSGALLGFLTQALLAGATAVLAIWLKQRQRTGQTPTV